jgi:hypothetical protein
MKLPLGGGCLCGAVRYRISAEPHDAGYCHCRMCQRSTGAPVVAWLTMASDSFARTSGTPTVHCSSQKAERLFCGTCGTQLVFREPAEPEYLEVTIASLDAPEALRPDHHVWAASRIAWFDTADDLRRYREKRRSASGRG